MGMNYYDTHYCDTQCHAVDSRGRQCRNCLTMRRKYYGDYDLQCVIVFLCDTHRKLLR